MHFWIKVVVRLQSSLLNFSIQKKINKICIFHGNRLFQPSLVSFHPPHPIGKPSNCDITRSYSPILVFNKYLLILRPHESFLPSNFFFNFLTTLSELNRTERRRPIRLARANITKPAVFLARPPAYPEKLADVYGYKPTCSAVALWWTALILHPLNARNRICLKHHVYRVKETATDTNA